VVDVPAAVSSISASRAGGSGEIQLHWGAADKATGYRILRSDTADGMFAIVADLNVVSGAATVADEVTNIWSDQHVYVPSQGAFGAPDTSPTFQYVESVGSTRHCFRVVAYNAAGEGPVSTVACGSAA
jgi:hypothetical protein